LPARWKLRDDFADVVDEAHIQHPVGFIEHEKLDFAETQGVAGHQIEQTPGSGNEHLDAVLQRAHLRAHRDATDRQRGTDLDMPPVSPKAVKYLAGQFSRRAEHQHAAGLALWEPSVCQEKMQDRQRERCGLAGAGLSDPDHVAARQNDGNGLRLNRRRRNVLLFSERARDRFGKAEIMKSGQ
jgi:hypothetical protein